jgi:DNA-binding MarR family transcriptional regulator
MEKTLNFFLQLAKTNTIMARRLSCHGLTFGDFMILYHLNEAGEGKLRRIDLAERLGLTASGITRMLLPLEKLHIIERDTSELDGRARYATLTPAGKQLLSDATATLKEKIEDIVPVDKRAQLEKMTELLALISRI